MDLGKKNKEKLNKSDNESLKNKSPDQIRQFKDVNKSFSTSSE